MHNNDESFNEQPGEPPATGPVNVHPDEGNTLPETLDVNDYPPGTTFRHVLEDGEPDSGMKYYKRMKQIQVCPPKDARARVAVEGKMEVFEDPKKPYLWYTMVEIKGRYLWQIIDHDAEILYLRSFNLPTKSGVDQLAEIAKIIGGKYKITGKGVDLEELQFYFREERVAWRLHDQPMIEETLADDNPLLNVGWNGKSINITKEFFEKQWYWFNLVVERPEEASLENPVIPKEFDGTIFW